MVFEAINVRQLVFRHVKKHYGDSKVLVMQTGGAASPTTAEAWAKLREDLARWRFELPRVFDDHDYIMLEGLSPSVAGKIMDHNRAFPMWYFQEGKCTARTEY